MLNLALDFKVRKSGIHLMNPSKPYKNIPSNPNLRSI
jgi:hypothetical protein